MFSTKRPRATGKRSICSSSSAKWIGCCLKPNDANGGHGVYFGSQLDEREWQSAIEKALSADYIVQDALDLHPEVFPIFSETDWRLQPMFVDTNPISLPRESLRCDGSSIRHANRQRYIRRRRDRIFRFAMNTPPRVFKYHRRHERR